MVWSGVDYLWIDVFISCLDSHSDGTHSLQRIHWWTSDVMLHFSKSDEETNSSVSWMAWRCVNQQQIFSFGWTIPLRQGNKTRKWHTKKENDKEYYHGEKALVPELGKTVPDAPFENTLPSANMDISKEQVDNNSEHNWIKILPLSGDERQTEDDENTNLHIQERCNRSPLQRHSASAVWQILIKNQKCVSLLYTSTFR